MLCGGATELVVKGFETLVEAGYQPEVAYFECLHELKLIVDLLHEGGLKKMHAVRQRHRASTATSRAGRASSTRHQREMKQVLKEIQDGTFAEQWIAETKAGQELQELHAGGSRRKYRESRRELRGRMSWLQE